MEKNFKNKLRNMPIAIVPTMVGAATLSNVYQGLGFTWIKHVTMWSAILILLSYLGKIVFHFDTVKSEYRNTVPASLYAGLTMITMIIGSYIFTYNQSIGKGLWLLGIILHAIHICIFTFMNVFKGINRDTFIPSWFVTYNGIMVATVVGGVMNEPAIGKVIVYYGITILCIIMPFMVYRLAKHSIKDAMYHTQAILLAPSSLCLVSYLNFIEKPNKIVVYALYALVFCSFLFILYKMPKFFGFTFNPGFAGLTFPMAIGIVASNKMAVYLTAQGYEAFGNVITQIAGIQIYVTTALVSFVLFKFFMMLVDSYKNNK